MGQFENTWTQKDIVVDRKKIVGRQRFTNCGSRTE